MSEASHPTKLSLTLALVINIVRILQKPYICRHPQCGLSFARPSHLSRHRLTHVPASDKRSISCSRCDRTFSRRDVLLRHLRTSHQIGDAKPLPRSAQKSCFRCVDKKILCERTQPCRGCLVSRSDCEYPDSASRAQQSNSFISTNDSEEQPMDMSSTLEHEDRKYEPGPLPPLNGPSAAGFDLLYPESDTNSVSRALRTPDSATGENDPFSGEPGTQRGSISSVSGYTETTINTALSHATNLDMFQSPFPGLFTGETHATSDTADLSPSYFALTQPDFRTNGFDWLDFDMPDFDFDPQQDLQPQAHADAIPQARMTAQDVGIRDSATGHTSDLSKDTISKATQSTSTLRPIMPSQAAQTWPFDQTTDASSQRYLLPPLREVLRNVHQSQPDHRRDSLVQLLSEQRLPTSGQLQGVGAIQALGSIQRLLDVYFSRFHDIQAIIHKPTWNMETCPTVLLTAMACVGALLSEDERDTELCSILGDICLPMIIWLGASDDRNYQDISFLNALCLHQIYSLGSGNRQLYQNADRSRGTLIGSLRGMGLLTSPWTTGDSESDDSQALASSGSQDQASRTREWHSWIKVEHERRAAWAAFEYDCSLCTLTSRRGAVDLGELPSCLPCFEDLWNASSAEAWRALRSRLGPASFSPSLSKVLKTALAGQDQAVTLGSWAARLCAQVLGRLLWDIKQLEVVAMPHHLGLSSLIDANEESKRSILSALGSLLALTANPLSTAGLITYNITGLLCHYSYLYAVNDVMDVIIYIVRRSIMSQDSHPSGSLQVARHRLKSTFAKDPRGTRTLVWHAAQIVAIANEYLVSAPCEIMRLFMGYIFIIAFSTYGLNSNDNGQQPQLQPVRLDVPGHTLRMKKEIAAWIEHGGPASVGKVEDICAEGSVSAISHDAQAMMQKLRCWGLAGKFARILSTLGTKGL